jgi:hypothetical protein
MNPFNIELHIEELVLHGFDRSLRYNIGDAVERELLRLLTDEGINPAHAANLETARLDAGAFHVAHDSKPEAIGAQVAQAVYGELKK